MIGYKEQAETGDYGRLLPQLADQLESYLTFEDSDAISNRDIWLKALDTCLPDDGVGIDQLLEQVGSHLLPNASAIPRPGFSSFITTGATTGGALVSLAAAVAAPQRLGLNAFSFLEQLSLDWLIDLFGLPNQMQGIHCSGGSTANIIALGAARQAAFQQLGLDVARHGVRGQCRLYASASSHHTIHRALAVLGLGRDSLISIPTNNQGEMDVDYLAHQLETDHADDSLPIAIVANAGSTSTGAIDDLTQIGTLARKHNIWFHVDGAYGLPGILDPLVKHRFNGLELADSVIVDPHKWLGAPVGIGTVFVKDRQLLHDSFTQQASDYLEGSAYSEDIAHSLDSLGIPYYNMGLELSAPCRGAVVWAILKEVGRNGIKNRVCRHNAMARTLAERVKETKQLELVVEPSLSICCFRFVDSRISNLNELNQKIHRRLLKNNQSLPSMALVDDKQVLRPCFISARNDWPIIDNLISEVLEAGHDLVKAHLSSSRPARAGRE